MFDGWHQLLQSKPGGAAMEGSAQVMAGQAAVTAHRLTRDNS